MMKKIIPLLLLVIALGYSILQLTEKKQEEKKVSKNDSYIASIQKIGVQVGQQAPDIELMTLDQKKVKLSSYKGKKVILNYWATWCPPCQDEIPVLEKFYQKNKNDIVILGVADFIGEKKDLNFVNNFVKKNNMHYQILLDETGDNFRKYGVISIPTTFFINPNGEVIYKQIGPLTEKQLNQFLK